MADDAVCDEPDRVLGNVKEIAVDVDRRSKRSKVSSVVSDVSDEEISLHHIRLFESAMCVNSVKFEASFVGSCQVFNCSLGFIRVKPSQFRDNTWHVLPVTCKHNLQDEIIGGHTYTHVSIQVATDDEASPRDVFTFLDKEYGDPLMDEATNQVIWELLFPGPLVGTRQAR